MRQDHIQANLGFELQDYEISTKLELLDPYLVSCTQALCMKTPRMSDMKLRKSLIR